MAPSRDKQSATRPARRGAPVLRANVAELRAVAHPLRLRLLELFAESPRTTKQVADLLRQPPTRLYHHVNALERAGLLQLKETRPRRGVVEKWYTARPRYAVRGGGTSSAASVTSVALTVLDQSRHEVAQALAHRSPKGTRPLVVRAVVVGNARVQATIRKRLGEFLAALQKEMRDKAAAAGKARRATAADQRWSLTVTLAPSSADTPMKRDR